MDSSNNADGSVLSCTVHSSEDSLKMAWIAFELQDADMNVVTLAMMSVGSTPKKSPVSTWMTTSETELQDWKL
jgi:hypothetical protein